MATEIQIFGAGQFKGHRSNINTFQYTEDATPHLPGDESGAIGELSFTVLDVDNKGILLFRDDFRFRDDLFGSVTGKVAVIDSNNDLLFVSGPNRLNQLNIEATFPAQETTVRGVFERIFETAQIFEDVAFDPNIQNNQVSLPGFTGNLWTFTKQVCAFFNLEISLINNTIYVRPIRQREVTIETISRTGYRVAELQPVQEFDVAYYNYQSLTDTLVYPKGGWTPEVQVYQVQANETVVFDIEVDAYLESVLQPVAQLFVDKDYSGPLSVYAISANDGLPIDPELWEAFGGSMSFELKDNGTVIEVTLTGPDLEDLAPYSVALSDGATQYSTLRIVGTGMFFDRQLHTVKTGLTPQQAPQVKGTEIDSIIIDTKQQAIDAGVRARRIYAMPQQTFEATGRQLVRKSFVNFDYFVLDDPIFGILDQNVLAFADETDVILFSTFDDYNQSLPAGYTFAQFNADYGASSFSDFAETLAATFRQSFGTVPGSRVKYLDAYYRVKSSDVNPEQITITADFDTLFSDFNDTFGTLTFDDYAGLFVGLEFEDYDLIPLRETPYFDYDFLVLDEGQLDINVLGFSFST